MMQAPSSEKQADNSQNGQEDPVRQTPEPLAEPKLHSRSNQALLRRGRAGAVPPKPPLRPSQAFALQRKCACGHDFSKVRVHTDATAGQSAQALNALAYTVGNDISFAPGNYQPETQPGRTLLAHELAHVLQKAQGNDNADTPRRAATISAVRFSVTNAPMTSFAVAPSFIPGKWSIDLKTDKPGLELNSAVNVNCNGGTAAGYEVGIVQVETSETSEATYFGLTPADGSLAASKSRMRKPSGPCIDSRGAFWTADATGEKSLKPPACGANIALPVFSDYPSDSYPGWIENGLTHKPNYVRDVTMDMKFVDALAVKTPTGSVDVLKWLSWNANWMGRFNSDASGSKPAGILINGGFWVFGDDNVRPSVIPSTYTLPAKTCLDIAAEAIGDDSPHYVVETNASY